MHITVKAQLYGIYGKIGYQLHIEAYSKQWKAVNFFISHQCIWYAAFHPFPNRQITKEFESLSNKWQQLLEDNYYICQFSQQKQINLGGIFKYFAPMFTPKYVILKLTGCMDFPWEWMPHSWAFIGFFIVISWIFLFVNIFLSSFKNPDLQLNGDICLLNWQ